MKKVLSLLMICLMIFVFNTCGKKAEDENKSQEVESVYIDSILDRKVFMSDMYPLYCSMVADIDTMLYKDWKDMTFRDLINDNYFISDFSSWEYHIKDEGFTSVVFSGVGKFLSGETTTIIEFVFYEKSSTPLVTHYLFNDMEAQESTEISAVSLQDRYNCDLAKALCYCDASFSILLTLSLIDLPDYEYNFNPAENNFLNYENEEEIGQKQDFNWVPYKVRTGGEVLNIRDGCGTEYEIIGYLEDGTDIVITEISGNWGYMISSYGVNGWVKGDKYEKKYGWVCMDYLEVIPCSP